MRADVGRLFTHPGQVRPRCGRFDWYVRDDPAPAALAVGRRSFAVTTGFLRLLYDGALSHRQAVAVFLHEAGHEATRR